MRPCHRLVCAFWNRLKGLKMNVYRLQTFESSENTVFLTGGLHSYAICREKSYTDGLIEHGGKNIIKHTRFLLYRLVL